MSAKASTVATYASATGTVYFGLTLNEIGVIVGICATVVTLVMNWYFKAQHLKIARANAKAMADE